ncbi:MAG: orotidine-5'-phosphate decarboxylase [Parachlamydiales bacterium]|nr:orotidine-5'-phosphate decarboxylase [Verrucomicrobiota bacterium]MBX3718046.1 orotidine-5'-phosphate decarboxylase [Candidatus Acheromyda pituitae]
MQVQLYGSRIAFEERANLSSNPTAVKLFRLMADKKTNLSIAADVTSSKKLLALAEQVGPHICVFKTHIDILDDFSPEVTDRLQQIAEQHQFLIFEDRKFADIGNTVVQQYAGGIYKIASWADIINAHAVPGPGIIAGLKEVGLPKGRALLMLAEMSSSGNLAYGSYTSQAVEMAKDHADFVTGFISMHKLIDDPRFIHMTPGVQLATGGDHLGQQYQTPESVIAKGSDVIIVGRGIYGSSDPKAQAAIYRKHAWDAYQNDLKA